MSPAVGLVEVSVAVALSWAFSPMVNRGVLMLISPAIPASLVSTINLVSLFRIILSGAFTVIFPAFPPPWVKASILAPSEIVKFGVSMTIFPAFPVVRVNAKIPPISLSKISTSVKTVPDKDTSSEAIISMFPAFP